MEGKDDNFKKYFRLTHSMRDHGYIIALNVMPSMQAQGLFVLLLP